MTEIKLKDGSTVGDPKLDRLVQFDERSKEYPIRTLLPYKPLISNNWRCIPSLNQGREGACTAFSLAHELAAQPIEKVVTTDLAQQIYWKAQQLDSWPGGCVDYETQCLSHKGWVNANELEVGDEILTFDVETDTTKWAIVEHVHQYNMPYRVWSDSTFAAAVTDNHKWPVRSRGIHNKIKPTEDKKYQLVETNNLRSSHQFPLAYPSSDLISEEFETWDDNLVKLVAWVCSEGWYKPISIKAGTSIGLCQRKYVAEIEELVAYFGIAHGSLNLEDGCRVWYISGNLAKQIREIAPDKAPDLDWLRSLSLRQVNLFIDTFLLGDGSSTLAEGNRQGRTVLHQNEGNILDSILAACAMAGRPVSRKSAGKGTNGMCESWTLRRSRNTKDWRKLNPSLYIQGDVWCPQTKYGTFVAKRGKNVFITGNSYPGAQPYYEGTSVLAAAKAAKAMGLIQQYKWAFGLQEVLQTLAYISPVVLGLNWYEGCMRADTKGFIHRTGNIVGGHAILAIGIDVTEKSVRLHNSWGTRWSVLGADCKISFTDLDLLLKEQGEALIAVDAV